MDRTPQQNPSSGGWRTALVFVIAIGAVLVGVFFPVPQTEKGRVTEFRDESKPILSTIHAQFVKKGRPVEFTEFQEAEVLMRLIDQSGQGKQQEFLFHPKPDGTVTFEGLPIGKYEIEISRISRPPFVNFAALPIFEIKEGVAHYEIDVGDKFLVFPSPQREPTEPMTQ